MHDLAVQNKPSPSTVLAASWGASMPCRLLQLVGFGLGGNDNFFVCRLRIIRGRSTRPCSEWDAPARACPMQAHTRASDLFETAFTMRSVFMRTNMVLPSTARPFASFLRASGDKRPSAQPHAQGHAHCHATMRATAAHIALRPPLWKLVLPRPQQPISFDARNTSSPPALDSRADLTARGRRRRPYGSGQDFFATQDSPARVGLKAAG